MNRFLIYIIFCLFSASFWGSSCSTTKRIADREVLYTGVKKMYIEPVQKGEKIPGSVMSAIKSPLSVAPNNPLFSPYVRSPFPFGLWVYNRFYTTREKGFKHWMYKKFAKEPILISKVQPELRLKVVEDILANNGYFGATTRYELNYNKRNKKKARVTYWVDIPLPYTYSNITYPTVESPITSLIDSLKTSSLLRVGEQYNVDTLTAERNRITNILRNKGYYFFQAEYIEYQADTTQGERKVDLRMVLKQGIPDVALKVYSVGDINVSFQNVVPGTPDTMRYGNINIAYQRPLKIRPKILAKSIELVPGSLYTVKAQNKTQENLNRLGIFKYVNLNVTSPDSLKGSDSLDVYVNAAFDMQLQSEFEIDVSSKSNSFIGPGATFSVSNKNLFKGGEIIGVHLNGAYEWQTGSRQSESNSSLLNSYEFGLNVTLTFPRFLVPKFIPVSKKYPASTTFQLGTDLMNRPKYFRMISFNGSATYSFQTTPYSFHSLTLFKLVYNKLLNTSESFNQTMEENPAIALSFKDQFIPSMSYSYTFDKSFGRTNENRIFWQNSVTSAGNILSGVMGLFGRKTPKKLFGSQFSQFVKNVSELKYYRRIGEDNWIASRFLVGVGYAYSNSTVMPYSEQFYIGGANSIRAFTVRSLGPGSYHPPANDKNAYLDQTGNFKLEANVEFRFKIWGRLHGAVFLDAGNIWLLKNDPLRPGGELKWNGLFKEVALGTGCGLRYDISYLVLRLDLGIGLHTPYDNPEKKGYYNISNFKDGMGLHLAIGYPF